MNNQITYADKVALNQNSNIPDNNKVNASDMNEIKSVVNSVFNGTISTNDFSVGGTLYTSSSGREDYADFGFYYDGAGNMQHKRNNAGDQFQIKAHDGTGTLLVYPESGTVYVGGALEIVSAAKIRGNVYFIPTQIQTLDLNTVGVNPPYNLSCQLALFNENNGITNAPVNTTVAIINCYSWGGNSDWVVQEYFDINNAHKYIRYRQGATWGNWTQIL